MAKAKTPYTLGLDIGIASVGAALLAEDHILALHVRAFDKAETAKEGDPLNKIRREARSTRRRIRRRSHRLLRLRRMFKRTGLLADAKPASIGKLGMSTWQLRSEGLDRPLDNVEWASVLYHIVKHRGFQSTRKSEAKSDEKVGAMLGGVSSNSQLLQNYRSIGEMVWQDERFKDAKRNKGGDYSHTFARADLASELALLFAQQRKLGNKLADGETEEFVTDLLMARRPALSGESLLKMVGKCTFETTEYRAPKACNTTERFVWLTNLNNLRIQGIGKVRALTDEERALLISLPFTQAKLTYQQVRKKLDLAETDRFSGLVYRSEKNSETATIFEAKAFHSLRKAYESNGLSEQWKNVSRNTQQLDDLGYALTVFKEDTEARIWLGQQQFTPEQIEAVLGDSFEKFINLSLKALSKILPFMEQGQRYDEAVISAGYQHHSQINTAQKSSTIPPISREDIVNHVVFRSLNQARKLVNAIVKEYGPPMAVHIEMARDLNKSFDERRKIEKAQKEFRDTKQADIDLFQETFGFTPKGLDLTKWRLYREQDGQCAYCQTGFDTNRLPETAYVEVDHVLPYSRSFDDSMNNKVLVCTKHNRDKGNRTPFEYLGGSEESEEWHRFVAWVVGNPKLRQAKRQRLLRKNFGVEESEKFKDRNLTDTRYACRKFKELVETHLQLDERSNSKRCTVVSGQLTSYLRARWGLLKIREDGDLHHALDAAVVAACSSSMVKRLSDYARRKELHLVTKDFVDPETGEILDEAGLERVENHFPQPWDGFRKELEARLSPNPAATLPALAGVAPVRVSRAPKRRGLGAAHQETIRSMKYWTEETKQSAVKTPLTKLKLKDLENIVGYNDPRNTPLMEAIASRLNQYGDDGAKAFKEPLYRPAGKNSGKTAPIVKNVKLLETQKSGLLLPSRGGGIANNGDMLRADIFCKKGQFFAVPLYVSDAVKNELPNRAVLAYQPESEWPIMDDSFHFMFSLYPNDWVKISFKNKPTIEGYYAGIDRSTGAVSIWSHDRSSNVGAKGLFRGIGIKTALKLEKLHVDLLGRLYLAKQEQRQPLTSRQP